MLEADGCAVSEVEQEDGLFEVAAIYEGQGIEFELAANGTVVEIGLDDLSLQWPRFGHVVCANGIA